MEHLTDTQLVQRYRGQVGAHAKVAARLCSKLQAARFRTPQDMWGLITDIRHALDNAQHAATFVDALEYHINPGRDL